MIKWLGLIIIISRDRLFSRKACLRIWCNVWNVHRITHRCITVTLQLASCHPWLSSWSVNNTMLKESKHEWHECHIQQWNGSGKAVPRNMIVPCCTIWDSFLLSGCQTAAWDKFQCDETRWVGLLLQRAWLHSVRRWKVRPINEYVIVMNIV